MIIILIIWSWIGKNTTWKYVYLYIQYQIIFDEFCTSFSFLLFFIYYYFFRFFLNICFVFKLEENLSRSQSHIPMKKKKMKGENNNHFLWVCVFIGLCVIVIAYFSCFRFVIGFGYKSLTFLQLLYNLLHCELKAAFGTS